MSIEQAAQCLGFTVRHVRRLMFERRIPYVKWGHLLAFDPTAIAQFIEAHTRAPIAVAGPASPLAP